MTRQARRVEPLPNPFVLPSEQSAQSRLGSRLVFVALADEGVGSDLVQVLQQQLTGDVHVAPSRLFASCLERVWGAYQLTSDIGLAPLLSTLEFLTLLRRLSDDLLSPDDPNTRLVVDPSPEHANRVSVEAICSVYPDAVVVVDAAVATDLAPDVRDRVIQWDGTTDALTEAVSRRKRITPAQPEVTAPSRWRDRVVVVVGSGRSGTTWLQQLWLAHADVVGLDYHESWMFHQLRHVWRVVDEGTGFARWVDYDSVCAALRRFTDGVFTCTTDRHGAAHAKFVVEKSPVHVERLREIAAVYPDAWVVHLVRDGRDVALSMSKVPFFEVPDVGSAAKLWQRAVDAVRESQGSVPRFRDVRYEDLVADAGSVMRELWAWVGLPETPETVRNLERAVATRVSNHGRTTTDAGSWAALDRSDLAAIYRSAGRALVREGYASRRDVWRARLKPARGYFDGSERA